MRFLGLLIAGCVLAAAQSASAMLIMLPSDTSRDTLNAWGAPRPVLTPRDNPVTAGPVALGDGVVFSSTVPQSVLGYTGSYGFGPGAPIWQSQERPMAGLNADQGAISFRFATPISGILAQTNWASVAAGAEPVKVTIYDEADQVLETIVLGGEDGPKAGDYLGFLRPRADIARISFSNGFIGARDFFSRYSSNEFGGDDDGWGPPQGSPRAPGDESGPAGINPPILDIPQGGAVPEPGAWALMLLGFGAMGVTLRRRRRRAFA